MKLHHGLTGATPDAPTPNNAANVWDAHLLVRPSTALSPRQKDVLMAVCAGHPNKVIARLLHISEKTVKAHLSAIFLQLKVSNRTQAALVARQLRLVPEPGLTAHSHRDRDLPPITVTDPGHWT